MAGYYKTDIRRLTLREGWNLTRNWTARKGQKGHTQAFNQAREHVT